jgi:uncharacterized protein
MRLVFFCRDTLVMSREYPDWVNPWKAAEGNRIYRGTIALARMTRLVTLLEDDSGEVAFEASFARDELGFATISLEVKADLSLLCQASLERFVMHIERNNQLAAVDDIDEQELVPGHYDAVWIESKRLEFLELIQDELILEVPQVPRKSGVERVRFSTNPDESLERLEEQRNGPFSQLQKMMHGDRKDST